MILILGGGVAGLSCALASARAGRRVVLVTPGAFAGAGRAEADGAARTAVDAVLAGGNTAMAQGGIAAAVGEGDSPAAHAADTIAAGAGLVDAEAAAVLTSAGAAAVRTLLGSGFPADRAADGSVALGLEAAHGRPRIVHAGEDRTGAALHAFLSAQMLALAASGAVEIVEHSTAVSLLTDAGAVSGALLRDTDGRLSAVRAEAVVLATGGYAGLYPRTSNHPGARGEGVVLAARAGALVADLEFVQFHPTVLAGTGFLVSEAVRGAGAVLRDGAGRRFMRDAHPAAELAPRDLVSRTVHRVMRERGEDAVWLDATGIEREGGPGTLARRFPHITATTAAQGYDWTREPIPVAPAAHYTMGGVATDLDGRTTVPGLFAAGEVACTGVHGANRLASNSLLEGLVFGERASRAAIAYEASRSRTGRSWDLLGDGIAALLRGAAELPVRGSSAIPGGDASEEPDPESIAAADAVRAAAEAGLGIERDAAGLQSVQTVCAETPGMLSALASMIADAAESRTESRGSHQRADAPETDPAQARRQAWVLTPPASAPPAKGSSTQASSPLTIRETFASC